MTLPVDETTPESAFAAARGHFKDESPDVFASHALAVTAVNEKYSDPKDRALCYILSSNEDPLWLVLKGLKRGIYDTDDRWLRQTELVGRINKANV